MLDILSLKNIVLNVDIFINYIALLKLNISPENINK